MVTNRLTAARWLQAFAHHLQEIDERGRLASCMSFFNSFEGWLKFEMAGLLCRDPWNYEPWHRPDPTREAWIPGDVGVEYRAVLSERGEKLIDVWASPEVHSKSWIFGELKVAFRNANKGKQIASWVGDFEALRRIDVRYRDQKVSSCFSALFAVGFEAGEFDAAVEEACSALPGVTRWTRAIPTGAGDLRICALIQDR